MYHKIKSKITLLIFLLLPFYSLYPVGINEDYTPEDRYIYERAKKESRGYITESLSSRTKESWIQQVYIYDGEHNTLLNKKLYDKKYRLRITKNKNHTTEEWLKGEELLERITYDGYRVKKAEYPKGTREASFYIKILSAERDLNIYISAPVDNHDSSPWLIIKTAEVLTTDEIFRINNRYHDEYYSKIQIYVYDGEKLSSRYTACKDDPNPILSEQYINSEEYVDVYEFQDLVDSKLTLKLTHNDRTIQEIEYYRTSEFLDYKNIHWDDEGRVILYRLSVKGVIKEFLHEYSEDSFSVYEIQENSRKKIYSSYLMDPRKEE